MKIEINDKLLAKYLCDNVSEVEKQEVAKWLNQSEENRKELQKIEIFLDNAEISLQAEKYNSVSAWEKVKSKIELSQQKTVVVNPTRKKALLQFYKYAAIIVFAVLAGMAAYYFGSRNTGIILTEITAAEKQVINEITLPDGSVVALNNNSKLVYPSEFDGETREVTIEGEAFFDVVPNAEKPFVINAGNARIKVLGTSFNVCAYPETETVEVVVATGKVQVISKNEEESGNGENLVLIPGEKGTLFNFTRILQKSQNADPNYLAWKTHDFIFEDVPLKEVFTSLEKIYHVNINVEEKELNDLLLNAQFDKKSIDFILNVVSLTFDLELSSNNELYTFSSRKNNKTMKR